MINDIVVGTVNGEQVKVTIEVSGIVTILPIEAVVSNRSFLAEGVPLLPGVNTITAIGRDRAGNTSGASINVTLNTAVGARINLVSGNNQTGDIGQILPQPLVVSLTNDSGNPVSGKMVIFKVVQNDGILTGGVNGGRALMVDTVPTGGLRRSLRWARGREWATIRWR